MSIELRTMSDEEYIVLNVQDYDLILNNSNNKETQTEKNPEGKTISPSGFFKRIHPKIKPPRGRATQTINMLLPEEDFYNDQQYKEYADSYLRKQLEEFEKAWTSIEEHPPTPPLVPIKSKIGVLK